MEFVANRNDLLQELALLQGVVERKSTIPVLAYALIESATDDYVRIRATDLDISLQVLCPAKTLRKGSLLVPAKRLFEIMRTFPEADVSFSKQENDWVKIVCQESEFRLPAQDTASFPQASSVNGAQISLDCKVMSSLIGKVIFAITQEESRYALGGAELVVGEGRMRMVATDSHRLAYVEAASESANVSLKALVPRKTLYELERLLADTDGSFQFSLDENHLSFAIGNRELVSRLLSGKFPNYELIMPKENHIKTQVSKQSLIQSIRRVALVCDERSRSVRLSLGEGRIEITARSPEAGEARDAISIDYSSEPLSIAFNSNYLMDFLSASESDSISIELKDEQSQAMFRPVDDAKLDYRYVVMPMRV